MPVPHSFIPRVNLRPRHIKVVDIVCEDEIDEEDGPPIVWGSEGLARTRKALSILQGALKVFLFRFILKWKKYEKVNTQEIWTSIY